MSRTETNSLEHVLLLIAAMDPRPWYPRVYARDYNVSLDDLNDSLLVLWNEGLLVKADSGSASTGAGLVLSLAGKRLLDNPTGLQRLNTIRPGRAAAKGQRGPTEDEGDSDLPEALPAGQTAQKIRAALAHRSKPVVTRALLILNFAVFFLGLAQAAQAGGNASASAFFLGPLLSPSSSSDPAASAAWTGTGSVQVTELMAGQWWRLLTCGFVHFGIAHIGMNMYVLFSAGRNGEQIWSGWRFLTIYLLSGLGGSVLAMYHAAAIYKPGFGTTNLAGASGAICGIIAAELVWVLLNGRYLPRNIAGGWLRTLVINGLLITVFSFMAGVSWQGHLGGAIVGALMAFILNVQRFAAAPWRWVVLVLLLLLPAGSWLLVDKVQAEKKTFAGEVQKKADAEESQKKLDAKKPRTREQEVDEFQDTLLPRITAAREKADAILEDLKVPLGINPVRRPPMEKLAPIIAKIEQSRSEMQQIVTDLAKAGPYTASNAAEEARLVGLEFMSAYSAFIEEVVVCLRDNVDPKDKADFSERQKRLAKARKQWMALLKTH